jgi:hypothetical protein
MTTPPGRLMRCISLAARCGSEQIDSGSPIASVSAKLSEGTSGRVTMSPTTKVARFALGPNSSAFARACSTMAAAWSTKVVG